MQVRLNNNMRDELNEILDLHKGYFGGDVDHLKAAINGGKDHVHMDKEVVNIVSKVQAATGISYIQMRSKNRERETVLARQYAMYRIYDNLYHLGYTLTAIGKMFNRDHATVLYAIKQMREALEVNDYLVTKIHERYGELESKAA